MQTFNIDQVLANPTQLFADLRYYSYAANIEAGMTHDDLVKLGIGSEEMKARYESEKGQA